MYLCYEDIRYLTPPPTVKKQQGEMKINYQSKKNYLHLHQDLIPMGIIRKKSLFLHFLVLNIILTLAYHQTIWTVDGFHGALIDTSMK